MGWLAPPIAGRLQPLASIPQRIGRSNLTHGAMPKDQPRCGSTRTPAKRLEIPAGIVEGRGDVGLMFVRIGNG